MGKRKRQFSRFHVDISDKGKKDREDIDIKTGKVIRFDSLLEKKFYNTYLKPRLESGEIADYDLQKKYPLQPSFKHNGKTIRAIDYVADFVLYDNNGVEHIFDCKGGMVDNVAKLKKKLMFYKYPDLDYIWITYSAIDGGWVDFDIYEANKKERKKNKKENSK